MRSEIISKINQLKEDKEILSDFLRDYKDILSFKLLCFSKIIDITKEIEYLEDVLFVLNGGILF